MKTIKVKTCLTYLDHTGKLKNLSFELSTKNVKTLFNNLVYDAMILSNNLKGEIKIQQTAKSLYISYLDVPGTNKIDQYYETV
jgi:hypothetical protein